MINDIKILKGKNFGSEVFKTDDRGTSSVTTTIKPGEPVMKGGAGGNFATPITNGKPIGGTDLFLGITHKESSETASVDGEVVVDLTGPGSILGGRATAATNINTAAKLLLLLNDYVNFDVTASTGTNGIFTIDEDEGDDQDNRSLFILGGDVVKGTLRVACQAGLFTNLASVA